MAWNWNESGRIDSFKFEKISPQNLNDSIGSLECLVTGGTLNFSYYSDLKVSGVLNVVNAPTSMSQDEYLIRVWYCPELRGEKQKIELGTFYFTANLHYENGMYKGQIELRSMLARHIDDVTEKRWTLSKNSAASDCFLNVFKVLGGFPKIEGIRDKKLEKQIVFDVGTQPMQILQYIADYCSGQVMVNPHGNTVLRDYITPLAKKKNIAHNITANANSVVKAGVDISNTIKQIPNRVVCVYDVNSGGSTTQYIGKSALAPDEPRSYQSIGRWITKFYKVTNCKKPYVNNLNALAKKYLGNLNQKNVYYEFETYYQPIEIGEVITFKYDDITVDGLVSDIDLSLQIGAKMKVKIRKV